MKVGHIIYKVNDLQKAVEDYRAEGFTVEYGTKKDPYNALIYFSEGPYLELLHRSGMPRFVKLALRVIGKGYLADRMNAWDASEEGLLAVCLEGDKQNIATEMSILKQAGQRFFKTTATRHDTHDRALIYTCVFPEEMKLPFLMSAFSTNPRPKNFTHANGVRRIRHVQLGTAAELMPLISKLCDDATLSITEGDGVSDLQYEYETR